MVLPELPAHTIVDPLYKQKLELDYIENVLEIKILIL